MITKERREVNRLAQQKYRNSDKGKEYMTRWREEHREHYLAYQRDASRKRYALYKSQTNKGKESQV